jgi:hypothetical protein
MGDSDGVFPDRRSFLVRSAATLAAGSLLTAQACTRPPPDPAAQLADFVALSSVLLGIDANKLGDPAGANAEIFAAAQKHDEALLGQLLQIYRAHASESPESVAGVVSSGSGAAIGFFAKAIMLAWLLGSWYDPASLQKAVAQGSGGSLAATIISANAYREAWAWKIGQTKAMGTTVAGFGYWASPPPPLAQFVGESR